MVTGEATNYFELRCEGSTLTEIVNREEVASIDDRSYAQGVHAIGVIGSAEQGPPSPSTTW